MTVTKHNTNKEGSVRTPQQIVARDKETSNKI